MIEALLWSFGTLFLQAYSLVLSFGTIPIKITLIYIKDIVQMLDLIFVSLGVVSLATSYLAGRTSPIQTVTNNAFVSFGYNVIT